MEHNEYSRERGEGGGGGFLVAYLAYTIMYEGFFPGGSVVNPPASSGDVGSFPELGKSPGEGNGNRLQYSCLENPMDRGAWWARVHWVAKIWTKLNDYTTAAA